MEKVEPEKENNTRKYVDIQMLLHVEARVEKIFEPAARNYHIIHGCHIEFIISGEI